MQIKKTSWQSIFSKKEMLYSSCNSWADTSDFLKYLPKYLYYFLILCRMHPALWPFPPSDSAPSPIYQIDIKLEWDVYDPKLVPELSARWPWFTPNMLHFQDICLTSAPTPTICYGSRVSTISFMLLTISSQFCPLSQNLNFFYYFNK